MYAAASYGRGGKPAEPLKRAEDDDEPMATPPGAVAPLGGWFSEAMLKAYDKHRTGAVAADTRLPATLDIGR